MFISGTMLNSNLYFIMKPANVCFYLLPLCLKLYKRQSTSLFSRFSVCSLSLSSIMKLLVFLLLPCLSLGKVSPGFGNCKEFFLNDDPPEFTPQWGNTVKEICQCVWDDYDNIKIKYHYATLYNTDWKIPIYSAYVFYGCASVGRVDRWYIEPQVIVQLYIIVVYCNNTLDQLYQTWMFFH